MLPSTPAVPMTAASKPRRNPRPTAKTAAMVKPKGSSPRSRSPRKAAPALEQPVVVPAASTPETSPEVTVAAPQVTQEQIGQRAFDIWLAKGRPYGQDDANWLQACAELGCPGR